MFELCKSICVSSKVSSHSLFCIRDDSEILNTDEIVREIVSVMKMLQNVAYRNESLQIDGKLINWVMVS